MHAVELQSAVWLQSQQTSAPAVAVEIFLRAAESSLTPEPWTLCPPTSPLESCQQNHHFDSQNRYDFKAASAAHGLRPVSDPPCILEKGEDWADGEGEGLGGRDPNILGGTQRLKQHPWLCRSYWTLMMMSSCPSGAQVV